MNNMQHTANGNDMFADAQPLILYDWSPIIIASIPFRPSFAISEPKKCTFLCMYLLERYSLIG